MNIHLRVDAIDLLDVHFTMFESDTECGQLVMCRTSFRMFATRLCKSAAFYATVTRDGQRFDLNDLTE